MPRARLALVFLAVLATAVLAACNGEPSDPDRSPLTQEPSPTQAPAFVPGVSREGPPNTFAYTVQAGDTLFSLAQRFSTTVEILVTINAIADVNDIPTGAVIFIPNVPPTPTATTPPTGPSVRIDNGPRNSGLVALTFDMGGRVDPALDIMQFLIDNEIRATIFMTGAMVQNPNTSAGRQVLALIDAHPDLFDLGNHSYSHPDFRDLSFAEMADELATTEAAIAGEVSTSPRPWFRPPFGGVNQHVLDGVGAAGYPYTVMWDVDTIDWLPEADDGPTTQEIVNKVVGNAQGGSIVLMHLGGYNTLDALPAMVAGLEAKGLAFGRLSDLFPD